MRGFLLFFQIITHLAFWCAVGYVAIHFICKFW